MSNSLRGKKISETYQKLVQVVEGIYYDGSGNRLSLGATGTQGPQGSSATGTQGSQGAIGTQGSQGAIGTQGPQGTDVTNFYTEFRFSSSVPFNSLYSYCLDDVYAGGQEFTPAVGVSIPGARTVIKVKGSGHGTISFLDISTTSFSQSFDTTPETSNVLDFFYDGRDYWVTIYQAR